MDLGMRLAQTPCHRDHARMSAAWITRLTHPSLLMLPLALSAAQPNPAPQEFWQEVAVRLPLPAGWTGAPLNRVALMPDGTVRVSDGAAWFAARSGGLEAAAAPDLSLETRWRAELPGRQVRQFAEGPDRVVLAATDQGLWERRASGVWTRQTAVDQTGRDWLAGEIRGVAVVLPDVWWIALPSAVACREDGGWRFWTGREGLPSGDLTCAAAGPAGQVWFGTRRGAVYLCGVDP